MPGSACADRFWRRFPAGGSCFVNLVLLGYRRSRTDALRETAGARKAPLQHVLRISRKIDYGLRAMIYLASIPQDAVVPFREIARQMDVPEDFLAKILKTLVDQGLVRSTRGPHGGYA